MRILIAEDNEVIREDLVEKVSSCEGMSVSADVATGEAAVSAYEEYGADVVLMDIEMESMYAGIDAAEEIISFDENARIIYLTSHESPDFIIKAMATGAKDYIVKDVDACELEEHIKAVYEDRTRLDARVQNVLIGEYKRLHKSEQNLLYFIREVGNLTPAEKELVAYILEGMKIKEIAKKRCREPVTVKSQIRTLLQKFGCSRTTEVADMIRALGLEHLFI